MAYFNLIRRITIFVLLFSITQVIGQQKKLQLHATSLGYGVASSSDPKIEGPALNFDFSTIYAEKHIYSLHFNVGSQARIFGDYEEIYELNLTYGRKVELAPKLWLEGHLGVGFFAYEDNVDSPILNVPDATIGFPVRAKLLYELSDRFDIGINPNANLNSVTNAFSGHFLLQYKFQ